MAAVVAQSWRESMARGEVAIIVEFPPEVRDEALIKGKELDEARHRKKSCIHYLWTADLNLVALVVLMRSGKPGLTWKPT